MDALCPVHSKPRCTLALAMNEPSSNINSEIEQTVPTTISEIYLGQVVSCVAKGCLRQGVQWENKGCEI